MVGRKTKINVDLLQKIDYFTRQNIDYKDICKKLKICKQTYYQARKVLDAEQNIQINNLGTCKINDLISLRLLIKCSDLKILAQRLAFEIAQKKVSTIEVQPRIKKIGYNKIIYLDKIIKKTGLKYKWQI